MLFMLSHMASVMPAMIREVWEIDISEPVTERLGEELG